MDNNHRDLNQEALDHAYGTSPKELAKQKEESEKLASIIVSTFESENGQACLEWLEETYFNQVSHTVGDSHSTAFKEGSRFVVLTIKSLINQASNKG